MKINKKTIILTSLVILIPALVGCLLWNQLPDKLATHFNAQGNADGYSSKLFGVFGLPCIVLILHLFCLFVTSKDPKNSEVSEKIMNLIAWICPIASLIIVMAIYPYNLGYSLNMSSIGMYVISFMFIIIGNYLPKCRQNYTIGIKLPWTLNDEENWNKTHRFAGKLWVAGGIVLLLCAILNMKLDIVIPIALLGLTLVPVMYSYMLYRNK